MKKNFFFFAMTAATLGFTGMVNAGDTLGTYEMQVTGNVLPQGACVVTAPSSLSFDNISPEDISLVGNGPKHDNLYLIEISGCRKDLKVSATVLGVADSINNELLSTQMVPGAAENVAVAFYEQVGNAHPVVAINTGHTSSSTINEFGTAQIIMQADVVLADYTKRATPGTIAANANVQINFL